MRVESTLGKYFRILALNFWESGVAGSSRSKSAPEQAISLIVATASSSAYWSAGIHVGGRDRPVVCWSGGRRTAKTQRERTDPSQHPAAERVQFPSPAGTWRWLQYAGLGSHLRQDYFAANHILAFTCGVVVSTLFVVQYNRIVQLDLWWCTSFCGHATHYLFQSLFKALIKTYNSNFWQNVVRNGLVPIISNCLQFYWSKSHRCKINVDQISFFYQSYNIN